MGTLIPHGSDIVPESVSDVLCAIPITFLTAWKRVAAPLFSSMVMLSLTQTGARKIARLGSCLVGAASPR